MTLVGPGHLGGGRGGGVLRRRGRRAASTATTPLAYALARPPGHHATAAGFGGSCYLNNAAVAAETLLSRGHERVAVVDVDAHHGNGTQAVFWERADVLYGSVHVDPGAGWFPHVVGYADEVGAGAGAGATRNVPLAEGTGDGPWLDAVEGLTDWVTDEGCTALVVSLGVDAAADDPESPLAGHRGRLPRSRPAARTDRPARRSRSRRAATTCRRSAVSSRRTSTGTGSRVKAPPDQ